MTVDRESKRYLGDGLYANRHGYYVLLTTEDGARVTNTIFLEPAAWKALVQFVESLDGWTEEE